MSAQLSQHVTTRLLIAEKSENAAHELDSMLRDAGIGTRLQISDDLAHIAQILSQGDADIALLTDRIEGLDQLLPRLRATAPHTPILLLTHNDASQHWTVASALAAGATDVIPAGCAEQLSLVVKRELEHICQSQHLSQVRRALKEAEQRCQLLLQGSKAAIAYIHEGMHIHANEGYLDLFGYNELDDLCAVSLVDLLTPDSASTLKAELKALRNGAEQATFEFTTSSDNAAAVSGSMTLENSQYEGENCLQITVRQGSTSEAVTTNDARSEQTTELELPGFIKAAETLFNNNTAESFLLVVGLDHYASLQKTNGLTGLEAITRKVWHQLNEIAVDHPLARVSNSEYAIAVSAENRQAVIDQAEVIRKAIGELIFEIHDKTVRPTISIAGAALDASHGVSGSLDRAYNKLRDLMAEESTNVVVIEGQETDTDAAGDVGIILKQITDAIDKKMFVVLFQPIISLRGDSDEHYEVFLRMLNESGEQIEPGRFLQTAIDNHVAGKIDRWVILQSIKMLSAHRSKGNTTRLTINLTANSVMDPEFLQWLGVAIKAARLPSDAVIFQITEKDATTYLRQTREFVEGLRDMHCRASLSRFGLIDDPFETLRHVPVDMVKLDGGCVNDADDNKQKRDVLMECISKLQSAGKLTVVPMVENANMLSTLWQAGANYIQGHYLQEPTTEMNYDFSTEE